MTYTKALNKVMFTVVLKHPKGSFLNQSSGFLLRFQSLLAFCAGQTVAALWVCVDRESCSFLADFVCKVPKL